MIRAAAFICLFFLEQSLCAALPPHSVSPSRQFVIYGGDIALRGTISELAEQTKSGLLALLRQRDEWKTVVIINLQSKQADFPEAPPSELRVSQTGFGLKLQLDLTIGKSLDGSWVERELLRAVLLEMIYRRQGDLAAGTSPVQPPDWLLEGVLTLMPGREREPLIEALLTIDKRKSLEEFLGQHFDLLDSAGRLLYRAYSVALVQLILEQGGGGARLAHYVANLSHMSNDPVADLKSSFPELRQDLEKKWRASMAGLSEHQTYHILSFVESERRLDELLQIELQNGAHDSHNPGTMDLERLARRKPSANEKVAINQMSQELLLFVGAAHPVLRPVAREYQQIAALLVRGKRRGIEKRLSRLEVIRKQLAARMGEIDDYMNWFEATQMEKRSGAFKDYLKAASKSEISTSRRRDPLSLYLDALQDEIESSSPEY
ncbi:MAG TPA: hypothetical protein VFQ83_12850 [Candidatus Udaeobacter sp.]|jgi:hypothetical protein|nr:hypothetical protein [Candidatus Udaeobacter sp.]